MNFVKTNNPINQTFNGLLNELFNETPAAFCKTLREDVLHFPPVNITEKAENYQISMLAPGLEKADFAIKLDGKILNISVEKKETNVEDNDKIIRKEFSLKPFKRSFTLDEKIDNNGINATYEKGILTVTLPKKEEVKTSATEINVL